MARTFEDVVDLWLEELGRNQPATELKRGGREVQVTFAGLSAPIKLSANVGSTRPVRRLL